MIPALYELPKRPSGTATTGDVLSCDAPSTSYPATTSIEEEWDVLGACMTTAQEMEACVDAVVSDALRRQAAQPCSMRVRSNASPETKHHCGASSSSSGTHSLLLLLPLSFCLHTHARSLTAASSQHRRCLRATTWTSTSA
jgi:hypothetical protein